MDWQKATFLVVDDYESIINMVKSNLRENGFDGKIITASNGKEAKNLLEQGAEVDFIICDFVMPEMNGAALLQWVRSQTKYQNLPYLMLTANQDRASIMECLKGGASNYLLKPWGPENLLAKIKYCWEKHH